MDVLPVLVAKPEFSLVDLRATFEALVEALRQLHVVWMDQAFPGADVRLDLVGLIAEHLDPARRVEHRARLEVPVPDALLRAGEREPEPFLALAERRLGQLPLGQVEVGADDADDWSAGPAPDRIAAREHMDVMAILVPQPELGFEGRLAARDAVLRLVGAPPIVRMDEPLERGDVRLDLVVVVVAEHLFPARRVETWPVTRLRSHTPSRAPATASASRSSLSRSCASARRRAVTSRSTSCIWSLSSAADGDLDDDFGRPGECEARVGPDVSGAAARLVERRRGPRRASAA